MKITLSAALCLLSFFSCAQMSSSTSELDFGFEKVEAGQPLPKGWLKWGQGYDLIVDSSTKFSGNNALLIKPTGTTRSFGSAAYQIPAMYEGKTIELKAHMKLEDVQEGWAGLLMRIDGQSGVLQFDNMQQKKLNGSKDWSEYSITLPLPDAARTIYVGALLAGDGQLWVDDFQVTIDGKDLSSAPKKEIRIFPAEVDTAFSSSSGIKAFAPTPERIKNIAILGMVWGFVKYYHPEVAKGNHDMDAALFRVLPKIIASANTNERDNILMKWLKGFGSRGAAANSRDTISVKFHPDLEWITNSGFNAGLTAALQQIQRSQRPGEHYYISQVPTVGNPVFNNEKPYAAITSDDRGYRLLSLFRYWNMIQYYFPYRHLIGEDWKKVLPEFTRKYLSAVTETEYHLAVLELVARLNDTHANVYSQQGFLKEYWGNNYAPVKLQFIEGKAVMTGKLVKDSAEIQITRGDEIVSVNKKPVTEIVKSKLKYTPGSNEPTKMANIAAHLLRTKDSTIQIDYVRAGKKLSAVLNAYPPSVVNIYNDERYNDTCFKMLGRDIGYIFLGSIRSAYIPRIMNTVKDTKGLIIDLRCYPREFMVFALGRRLVCNPTRFVEFTTGSVETPGRFTMTQPLAVGDKNDSCYKGKIVILVDERTVSQAEYTTMAFQASGNATVIGSTTAGADGNVSMIMLPSGLRTAISGIGVYYPDGRETQRVGIPIDIEVKPTVKGVADGRDEVLEKAVKYLRDL